MAQVVKYQPFSRGDTPTFGFSFNPPFTGFDWTGITIDGSVTAVEAPNDNTGAAVVRLGQPITVLTGNVGYFSMQPTVLESKSFVPGTEYTVQVQLKQGTTSVVTPVTGKVTVSQDYII